MQRGDNVVGKLRGSRLRPKGRRVQCNKDLREAALPQRIRRKLMGRLAQRSHRRNHVQHDGKPGAFPVSDGERALRFLNGGWIAREVALQVEAPIDRQQFTAHSVALDGAIRELGRCHIQHNRAFLAGHGDDQGIIANAWIDPAPRGHIGHGVRPANADEACLGSLPSIGACAHPVVGVAQSDGSNTVLAA